MHDEGVGAGVAWLAVVEYVDDHMLRVDRVVNAMVDYLLCILKLVLGGFSVYTQIPEREACVERGRRNDVVGEVLPCVVDGVTPSVASTTAVVQVVADEPDVVVTAGVVVVSTTVVADRWCFDGGEVRVQM